MIHWPSITIEYFDKLTSQRHFAQLNSNILLNYVSNRLGITTMKARGVV